MAFDKAATKKWRDANREEYNETNRRRRRRDNEVKAGRPMPSSCELCNTLSENLSFDHCHASGKFRGWLCRRCNTVLGAVEDSEELLRNMADYLRRTR